MRVALGASGPSILRMIVTNGMKPAAFGLALGLVAALGVTRVLDTLLVGVSPTDPLTFGLVGTLLLISAILGCMIPARRAMRVDPAIAFAARVRFFDAESQRRGGRRGDEPKCFFVFFLGVSASPRHVFLFPTAETSTLP